jgi:predicted AlkP superfamily pyrophosphatase or phosphodiesterase
MRASRAHSVVAIALSAICGACAGRQAFPTSRAAVARPYVVMVSFDAFRHDYVERYQPAAFVDIAARGVQASALIPSFPSKTFPNHYSIATGLYPGDHGITGNAFFDPARGEWFRVADQKAVRDSSWYAGEPIWVTAERNGVRSGVYFWPGSEAAIGGVRPSYVVRYDGKVPNATRVNTVSSWLRKPSAERPHLVLLYLSDVDDTTHMYGPEAPQTAVVVASVNRTLRQLMDSLSAMPFADSVNIVLVSDHGMTTVRADTPMAVSDILARAGIDTTRMQVSDNGPAVSLWFGTDSARMRAAHGVLDRSLPHARTYFRSETPPAWHMRDHPRAGDLLIVADEGYIVSRRASDKPPTAGAHGYDPTLADMQAIFIAAGPNIRPLGTLPPFENVDIYPFLAALLRLERVPHVDGNAATLSGVIR